MTTSPTQWPASSRPWSSSVGERVVIRFKPDIRLQRGDSILFGAIEIKYAHDIDLLPHDYEVWIYNTGRVDIMTIKGYQIVHVNHPPARFDSWIDLISW